MMQRPKSGRYEIFVLQFALLAFAVRSGLAVSAIQEKAKALVRRFTSLEPCIGIKAGHADNSAIARLHENALLLLSVAIIFVFGWRKTDASQNRIPVLELMPDQQFTANKVQNRP